MPASPAATPAAQAAASAVGRSAARTARAPRRTGGRAAWPVARRRARVCRGLGRPMRLRRIDRSLVPACPWHAATAPAVPGRASARFPPRHAPRLRAGSPWALLLVAPGALNELLEAAASLTWRDPGIVAHRRAPAGGSPSHCRDAVGVTLSNQPMSCGVLPMVPTVSDYSLLRKRPASDHLASDATLRYLLVASRGHGSRFAVGSHPPLCWDGSRRRAPGVTAARPPEPPSSSGLGHRPFKAAARVRIPLGARSPARR